ncbi:hypothetical protein IOD06_12260 [Psychrobacter sp. N25K4-3-2]|uniref:hypothetical protein n=1 Tax=Psychrobacter sp. N25K4-3-2 TaxID=2785026 RepID=UPI001889FD23|nr:hypothetical protein [Psychrobacter sp. N25K4-3-2]MBF4490660.1 hypothetical protein [Psychrobacter sp. N25K4-3-2]
METFLIVAVITVVLFLFMKGLFSFKNATQLTLRPFNEWIALAKGKNKKEREVMSHTILLETGSLLEKANIISQREFEKIFSGSSIYASDVIILTLITTHIQDHFSESSEFPLNESKQARIYFYNCFCRLYFEGFYSESSIYKGKDSLIAMARYANDKEQQPWD